MKIASKSPLDAIVSPVGKGAPGAGVSARVGAVDKKPPALAFEDAMQKSAPPAPPDGKSLRSPDIAQGAPKQSKDTPNAADSDAAARPAMSFANFEIVAATMGDRAMSGAVQKPAAAPPSGGKTGGPSVSAESSPETAAVAPRDARLSPMPRAQAAFGAKAAGVAPDLSPRGSAQASPDAPPDVAVGGRSIAERAPAKPSATEAADAQPPAIAATHAAPADSVATPVAPAAHGVGQIVVDNAGPAAPAKAEQPAATSARTEIVRAQPDSKLVVDVDTDKFGPMRISFVGIGEAPSLVIRVNSRDRAASVEQSHDTLRDILGSHGLERVDVSIVTPAADTQRSAADPSSSEGSAQGRMDSGDGRDAQDSGRKSPDSPAWESEDAPSGRREPPRDRRGRLLL